MPPAALTCAMARSVFTRISAPSTAVEGAWSSRTPILMGGPEAWLDWVVEAPPPQAVAANMPTTAATRGRHHLDRPDRPDTECCIAAPPSVLSCRTNVCLLTGLIRLSRR